MTGLVDLTGRTNGAGDHMWVAGVEYVWVVNEAGRLVAERFDREGFDEVLAKATGAGS